MYKYPFIGGGNGIEVVFNSLSRDSASPFNVTVSVTLVEENLLSLFHIGGRLKTIQLHLELTESDSYYR